MSSPSQQTAKAVLWKPWQVGSQERPGRWGSSPYTKFNPSGLLCIYIYRSGVLHEIPFGKKKSSAANKIEFEDPYSHAPRGD